MATLCGKVGRSPLFTAYLSLISTSVSARCLSPAHFLCRVSINSWGVQIIASRLCVCMSEWPACTLFQDQIRGCFSFFVCAESHTHTHTPNAWAVQQTGKLAYLPLLSGGQWRGVNPPPTPPKKASCVFIVHSLPLFSNWLTLWTARCDAPKMWLHIPAFGACVISFNSSVSLSSLLWAWLFFSPFLLQRPPAPDGCQPTRSLIPVYTWPFSMGSSPLAPRKTPSQTTDVGNSHVSKHCAYLAGWNFSVQRVKGKEDEELFQLLPLCPCYPACLPRFFNQPQFTKDSHFLIGRE